MDINQLVERADRSYQPPSTLVLDAVPNVETGEWDVQPVKNLPSVDVVSDSPSVSPVVIIDDDGDMQEFPDPLPALQKLTDHIDDGFDTLTQTMSTLQAKEAAVESTQLQVLNQINNHSESMSEYYEAELRRMNRPMEDDGEIASVPALIGSYADSMAASSGGGVDLPSAGDLGGDGPDRDKKKKGPDTKKKKPGIMKRMWGGLKKHKWAALATMAVGGLAANAVWNRTNMDSNAGSLNADTLPPESKDPWAGAEGVESSAPTAIVPEGEDYAPQIDASPVTTSPAVAPDGDNSDALMTAAALTTVVGGSAFAKSRANTPDTSMFDSLAEAFSGTGSGSKPDAKAAKPSVTSRFKFKPKAAMKAVPLLGTAATAYEAYNVVSDENATGREKATSLAGMAGGLGGMAAGASSGAAIGATLGSVVPILGTAAGAAIGGFLGGMIGYAGGDFAGSSLADFVLPSDAFNGDAVEDVAPEQAKRPDVTQGQSIEITPETFRAYLPSDAQGFADDQKLVEVLSSTINPSMPEKEQVEALSAARARQTDRMWRLQSAVYATRELASLPEGPSERRETLTKELEILSKPNVSRIDQITAQNVQSNEYFSSNGDSYFEDIDAANESALAQNMTSSSSSSSFNNFMRDEVNTQPSSVMATGRQQAGVESVGASPIQAERSSETSVSSETITATRDVYVPPKYQQQAPAPVQPQPEQKGGSMAVVKASERPQPAPRRPSARKPNLDDAPLLVQDDGINLITNGVI